MRKSVPANSATTLILLALAGGAAALLIWSVRKRKYTQQDAVLAEGHLQHTDPPGGWSRWGQHPYTSPAGSLGAATR